MAVLAVIALTAVTMTALLGMLLTTVRTTSAQEADARELRAADSAIEAAIAQMRDRPAGDGADPCAVEAPFAALDQITFDQANGPSNDDVDVQVSCTPTALGDPTATADQVRLVGPDGYQGEVNSGGFPWPSGAPGGTPNLVYTGPEALRFDSGVTVKGGAAVLRDPVSGTPAVTMSGQYLQGDGGCDALSVSSGGGPSVIDDLDDAPECSSAAAAAVDGSANDPMGFAVTPGTPTVPTSCAAVIQIQPGTYDAGRTKALNGLINSCDGSTFHFLPGVISFDADNPGAGANRNALVLQGDRSYFVFGAAQGWSGGGVQGSSVAANPAAPLCSPSASGTSVVLSGRTEIRHLGGRVAMCPSHSGDPDQPFPAIYQQSSVPSLGIAPVGTIPALGYECLGSPIIGVPQPKPCTVTRNYDLAVTGSGAQPIDSLVLLLKGTEGNQTQNNLILDRSTSVAVIGSDGGEDCNTGAMSGTPNGDLVGAFELLTGGCAGIDNEDDLTGTTLRVSHTLTLTRLDGIFDWVTTQQTLLISDVGLLVNGFGGDASAVASQSGWTNANRVLSADGSWASAAMPCANASTQRLCLVPRDRETPDQRWIHSIALDDLGVDLPSAVAASGVDPNLTGLQVVMKVDPLGSATGPSAFRTDMETKLVLTSTTGQRCVVSEGSVNAEMEIAFDLLGAAGADPACTAALENVSDVDGADLSIEFGMACSVKTGEEWRCADTSDPIVAGLLSLAGITATGPGIIRPSPPDIDHIGVVATTDSYFGPTTLSQVNINATTSAAGSSFNTLGSVLMPRSDLDVFWRGPVTTGRSVIGGDLVLNGLGSRMDAGAEMGSLCCSNFRPGSRTVEFTATVDGNDLLKVTVLFTDIDPAAPSVYAPGYQVDVLDWATCDATGCRSSLSP
jgi:hypothetical protein